MPKKEIREVLEEMRDLFHGKRRTLGVYLSFLKRNYTPDTQEIFLDYMDSKYQMEPDRIKIAALEYFFRFWFHKHMSTYMFTELNKMSPAVKTRLPEGKFVSGDYRGAWSLTFSKSFEGPNDFNLWIEFIFYGWTKELVTTFLYNPCSKIERKKIIKRYPITSFSDFKENNTNQIKSSLKKTLDKIWGESYEYESTTRNNQEPCL